MPEGWKPSDDYLGETIKQLMKFEKYFCQSSPPPGKNPGYALDPSWGVTLVLTPRGGYLQRGLIMLDPKKKQRGDCRGCITSWSLSD